MGIKILKKEYEKEAFVSLLTSLDTEALVKALVEKSVLFAKGKRVALLQEAVANYVKAYKAQYEGSADQLLYRLQFIHLYGEYQLQNLLPSLTADEQNAYLVSLYGFLYEGLLTNGVDCGFIGSLPKAKASLSVVEVDALFNEVFLDEVESDLDALTKELVRPVLYHGSLIVELRALGLKYGVKVPARFKKEDLISRILIYFNVEDEEKETIREKLKTLPVVLIERFAKDNNIKVSADFKKEDIIEYILKELNKNTIDGIIEKTVYYFTAEQKLIYGLTHIADEVDVVAPVSQVVTSASSTTTTTVVQTTQVLVKDADLNPIDEKVNALKDLLSNVKPDEEVAAKEEEKKKTPWWKVLLWILLCIVLVVVFVFVAIVIYGIITQYYKGDFQEQVDYLLNKLKFGDTGFMDWLRGVLSSMKIDRN